METSNMMQEIKSSLGLAGIDLLVREQAAEHRAQQHRTVPVRAIPAATGSCPSSATAASWYFDADPSGEQIFATGASSNLGSYSDTTTDELVGQTEHSADPAAIQRYNDHVARDLPVAWVPKPGLPGVGDPQRPARGAAEPAGDPGPAELVLRAMTRVPDQADPAGAGRPAAGDRHRVRPAARPARRTGAGDSSARARACRKIEQFNHDQGFDQPLPVQYLS
ncbi:hypothetical protein BC739_009036 [Kutzneria viridogrisea]|uniref:Uncharacterized protein n=2 Tax=Kutzneria viridogrisea TaxID=47990 RepID=A0ABR6BXZ2_9PSEU|nr:hypothetical protein [Kutzneria viridogrisea]